MSTNVAIKPHSGTRPRSKQPRLPLRMPTVYFWLLIPAFVVVVAFTIWPLMRTLYLSFCEMKANGVATWVGVDNYVAMWGDKRFWAAVWVTVMFVVVGVTVQLLIAWILALVLEQYVARLSNFLRTLFAIPMMLSPVVIGICWRALLNPQFGWVNAIFGLDQAVWTGNPKTALWVLVAVDAWQWTPFLFLIISAGLMSIPEDVIEAAQVDGASPVSIFMRIKLPLMAPAVLVGILLRGVDATKCFELPFNLTSGGPGNTTTTIAIFMYRRGFGEWDQGYASAVAVAVIVALSVAAFLFISLTRRVEERVS